MRLPPNAPSGHRPRIASSRVRGSDLEEVRRHNLHVERGLIQHRCEYVKSLWFCQPGYLDQALAVVIGGLGVHPVQALFDAVLKQRDELD